MSWLRRWWFLILACIIGGALGWGLGELIIMIIDKRIQEAIGG